MESAIRYHNAPATTPTFLHVDVAGRTLNLCQITALKDGRVSYETIFSRRKLPPFRAFEWSPTNEPWVALAQPGGEATLVRLDDEIREPFHFQAGKPRQCNAVALSSQNLLAAGLDKVRTDFCLNIWDVRQHVAQQRSSSPARDKVDSSPLHKLAGSEPITSLRFFQDQPKTIVAGVKGQFIRLYDLRDSSDTGGIRFATRCVHNIAIDGRDENYFASSFPTGDPEICVWDRRMVSRSASAYPVMSEHRQPESSLTLKNVLESPGNIWSLRFSRTQRGRLGVLSNTGQLKVYSIVKEYTTGREHDERSNRWGPDWGVNYPQPIFLEQSEDVKRPLSGPLDKDKEGLQLVSFDFMDYDTPTRQPTIIGLALDGTVNILTSQPPVEPLKSASAGYLCHGARLLESAASQEGRLYHEELVGLHSIDRLRCKSGYFFSPATNRVIVATTQPLSSLWWWLERASQISRKDGMLQANLDLSYLGIHALWMEEVQTKKRLIGAHVPNLGIQKHIKELVKRLDFAPGKLCETEYPEHRALGLYTLDMAWSKSELEVTVRELVSQGQRSHAAALALFCDERRLAYRALRGKGAVQNHRMLAMAIAGAAKRHNVESEDRSDPDASDADNDWSETISSLANELEDPYERAILAYVRTRDWSSVLNEETLPIKDRLMVALRWYNDARLTQYIKAVTQKMTQKGDIEAVVLTGTSTPLAMSLMSNYIYATGDLQSAFLALSVDANALKYLSSSAEIRKYHSWRLAYRSQLNSWGLKFHRVRLDIQLTKLAVDVNGRKLIQPAKPQVKLVCGYCTQSLAWFDKSTEAGKATTETGDRVTETPGRHPLTAEKAAAIGTVCPKCGRHLPRCGVCDLWLGTPDPSFTKWYGPYQQQQQQQQQQQNATHRGPPKAKQDLTTDMSASMVSTGSAATTVGPTTKLAGDTLSSSAVDAAKPPETAPQSDPPKASWESLMSRFTVFCTQCRHGFHAAHARDWFQGYAGRAGHRVCPVSTCACVCGVVVV